MARGYPGGSGHKAGTHPGQDALPQQGVCTCTHIHICTHSLKLKQFRHTIVYSEHLWDTGGNMKMQRKPMQTCGELDPGQELIFFLINIITKWCWMKYYLRTYCILHFVQIIWTWNYFWELFLTLVSIVFKTLEIDIVLSGAFGYRTSDSLKFTI